MKLRTDGIRTPQRKLAIPELKIERVASVQVRILTDVYKTWTRVHGAPLWTRSMDHPMDPVHGPPHGSGPWTPYFLTRKKGKK